ncbi:hypothetical protein BC832DRAFT_553438 [Gaertneriomyces semiglobifer]|nr:hypothetical protein BC832DRAFT_553438 [Gaertneriomyces semiglobifer]
MVAFSEPVEAVILSILGVIANIGALFASMAMLVIVPVMTLLGHNPAVPRPRSVLITGASSGIGEAVALEYARPDTHLVLVARNKDRLQKVKEDCERKGATVETKSLDVTNSEETKKFMTEVDQRVSIDLVIANAGGSMQKPKEGEFWSDSAERLFTLNVVSVFQTVAPIMKGMAERGGGQVAITSSLSGVFAHPGLSCYAASKAALNSFARDYRSVAARKNIRLSCICPGFVESRLTDELKEAGSALPSFAFMSAPKAARYIAKGLENDVGFIAFPNWQYYPTWMASSVPPFIQQTMSGFSRLFALTGKKQS